MRANTIWGFITIAVAIIVMTLTPEQTIELRPLLWLLAAIWVLVSVIILIWPIIFLKAILKKLTVDERYLIASEGVILKRTHFGPFPHDNGAYGYMTWDQARSAANSLVDRGIVIISAERSTNGQYTWTWFGRRVLKQIPKEDGIAKRNDDEAAN